MPGGGRRVAPVAGVGPRRGRGALMKGVARLCSPRSLSLARLAQLSLARKAEADALAIAVAVELRRARPPPPPHHCSLQLAISFTILPSTS